MNEQLKIWTKRLSIQHFPVSFQVIRTTSEKLFLFSLSSVCVFVCVRVCASPLAIIFHIRVRVWHISFFCFYIYLAVFKWITDDMQLFTSWLKGLHLKFEFWFGVFYIFGFCLRLLKTINAFIFVYYWLWYKVAIVSSHRKLSKNCNGSKTVRFIGRSFTNFEVETH